MGIKAIKIKARISTKESSLMYYRSATIILLPLLNDTTFVLYTDFGY